MPVPGIGTLVRYHMSYDDAVIDVPAVVVATSTNGWSDAQETYFGNGGPAGGEVYLVVFETSSGVGLDILYNVSEGTSAGEFSLLAVEAEDS